MLVEPACGAALAAVYDDKAWAQMEKRMGEGPVVVVVCGGSGVSPQQLCEWQELFSTQH